jgi:hypothetical protein
VCREHDIGTGFLRATRDSATKREAILCTSAQKLKCNIRGTIGIANASDVSPGLGGVSLQAFTKPGKIKISLGRGTGSKISPKLISIQVGKHCATNDNHAVFDCGPIVSVVTADLLSKIAVRPHWSRAHLSGIEASKNTFVAECLVPRMRRGRRTAKVASVCNRHRVSNIAQYWIGHERSVGHHDADAA